MFDAVWFGRHAVGFGANPRKSAQDAPPRYDRCMKPSVIQHLLRNPAALVRYHATGRLPTEHVPKSPLISLLEQLGPGQLVHIRGLTIDQRLGYQGTRTFAWAAQGLEWLKPRDCMRPPASEGWRDKGFQRPLYLEDLAECCTCLPESIFDRNPRLQRPSPRRAGPRP